MKNGLQLAIKKMRPSKKIDRGKEKILSIDLRRTANRAVYQYIINLIQIKFFS